MNASQRQIEPHDPCEPYALILRKGGHTWRFGCSSADASVMVQTLSDMAENDDTDLDWLDAALVAYELGRRVNASQPQEHRTRFLDRHTRSEAPR